MIQQVQRFDAGTYLCRASNGIGQPQAKVISVEILGEKKSVIFFLLSVQCLFETNRQMSILGFCFTSCS